MASSTAEYPFCPSSSELCAIMLVSGIIPFLLLFVIGIYIMNKIFSERIKVYGSAPGFRVTRTYTTKQIISFTFFLVSITGLVLYIVTNESKEIYVAMIVVYALQIVSSVVILIITRLEFKYLGFTTEYFKVYLIVQAVFSFVEVLVLVVLAPAFERLKPDYFFIVFVANMIILLAYTLKYPHSVPKEEIEKRLQVLEFIQCRKKNNMKLHKRSIRSGSHYSSVTNSNNNNSNNNGNNNNHGSNSSNNSNNNYSQAGGGNSNSASGYTSIDITGYNIRHNSYLTRQNVRLNAESIAESARFNALAGDSEILSDYGDGMDANANKFTMAYVVGWQLNQNNPYSDEIYFMVEYEQDGEVNFTYRTPKEFQSLFNVMKRNNEIFEVPRIFSKPITRNTSTRFLEYARNLLSYFLELVLSQDVNCLNFRQFFLPRHKMLFYQSQRLMSFAHNDYGKLAELGVHPGRATRLLSQAPLEMSFGNEMMFDLEQNQVKNSLLALQKKGVISIAPSQNVSVKGSGSQQPNSSQAESSIAPSELSINEASLHPGVDLHYDVIEVVDSIRVSENGEAKTLYNIHFRNRNTKLVWYRVYHSYVEFYTLHNYLSDLYNHIEFPPIEDNYTEMLTQSFEKKNEIEARLSALRVFTNFIVTRNIISISIYRFLETNKIMVTSASKCSNEDPSFSSRNSHNARTSEEN